MRRPWYLNGVFIFISGYFTFGIGWLVLGIKRFKWNKEQIKEDLYNMLVQNNGNEITRKILMEVECARRISALGMITICRHYVWDEGLQLDVATKLLDVGIRGTASEINLAEAEKCGYEIKKVKDGGFCVHTKIKGEVNNQQIEGYIRYLGEVLTTKYQKNGNDIVNVDKDLICIIRNVKDVVENLANR